MTWWRGIGSPRMRCALLVVLLVGGGLRAAWVAHAGVAPRFSTDPAAYLLQGETIARGKGFTNPLVDIQNEVRKQRHERPLPRQPSSFYPPGYPVFVAAVVWAVWHTPIPDTAEVRTVGYVQVLVGVLTILLAFAIGRRVFDARVGIVAAAMVALYPNLVTTTATLQLETVFVALTLATVLVLLPVATREDTRAGRLVASGMMLGAVALVRPTIALLLVAVLATRLLMKRPWRETLAAVAVLAIAMVAVMLPWTIRNAVALHAFVPISTGVGPTLCASRNPEATGALDTGILERQCLPKHQTGSISAREVAANSYGTRQAIRWVVHHPVQELRMWFWRTELSYRSDSSGLDDFGLSMDPRWYKVATALSDTASFVVLGFAAIGVVVIATRKRPAGAFLLGSARARSGARHPLRRPEVPGPGRSAVRDSRGGGCLRGRRRRAGSCGQPGCVSSMTLPSRSR